MTLSVSKALNALLPASLQGNPLAIYGIFAGVFALLTVSASVRVCARACVQLLSRVQLRSHVRHCRLTAQPLGLTTAHVESSTSARLVVL